MVVRTAGSSGTLASTARCVARTCAPAGAAAVAAGRALPLLPSFCALASGADKEMNSATSAASMHDERLNWTLTSTNFLSARDRIRHRLFSNVDLRGEALLVCRT